MNTVLPHDGRLFHTPQTNWHYTDGTVIHIDGHGCAQRTQPKVSGKDRKRLKKQRAKGRA